MRLSMQPQTLVSPSPLLLHDHPVSSAQIGHDMNVINPPPGIRAHMASMYAWLVVFVGLQLNIENTNQTLNT